VTAAFHWRNSPLPARSCQRDRRRSALGGREGRGVLIYEVLYALRDAKKDGMVE